MKLLSHLEKQKEFWFLLFTSFLFFLLRLPSLFEPYWYGDEGIYQVISHALHHGRLLYVGIWDNKPPLLYLLYAVVNGDQFSIRLMSLIAGIVTVILFFFLSQKIFQRVKISYITTAFFALLFATPFIEGNIANAENFMLPLSILTATLVFTTGAYGTNRIVPFATKKVPKTVLLFFAGIVIGIAFLFKIVAIFDFAAFFLFLFSIQLPANISLKRRFNFPQFRKALTFIIPYLLGFILPMSCTFLYFASQGTIFAFLHGAFLKNVGYVGYENDFFIPQGFLVFKLLLLTLCTLVLFLRRNSLPPTLLFVLLWLVFSLFSAFFSQRPYTHYMLVLLPSFCLFFGLILLSQRRQLILGIFALLALVLLLYTHFKFYDLRKTFTYYPNFISFITNRKDITSYQTFFDQNTPRDYAVALYLKTHTNKNDSVYIWGDSAQIYAMSDTLPPGRYTVAYHIEDDTIALKETEQAIGTAKPRYIAILPNMPTMPFSLAGYRYALTLYNTVIYERIY